MLKKNPITICIRSKDNVACVGSALYNIHLMYPLTPKSLNESHLVPIPKKSFAILGKKCSIRDAMFGSQDMAIMYYRGSFADMYNGCYMGYHFDYHVIRTLFNAYTVRPTIVLTDPDLIESVLSDPTVWHKPDFDNSAVRLIMGKSCSRSNGNAAVRQRKIMSSSFRNRMDYKGYLKHAIYKFETSLQQQIQQSGSISITINMVPIVKTLSIDIVTWILFGSETPGVEQFKVYYSNYWDYLRINKYNLSSIVEIDQRNKGLYEHVIQLRQELEKLIKTRRGMIMDLKLSKTDGNSSSSTKDTKSLKLDACVIDKLIGKTNFDNTQREGGGEEEEEEEEEGNEKIEDMFTLEELVHNCYSFMTAGYETTAHTISTSLYHLATNKTIPPDEISNDPKLLKAFVKESLRLYPPVLQMARTCMVKAKIGKNIQCNQYSRILIDIVGMHYRRSIFGDDYQEFKPMRWLVNVAKENEGVNISIDGVDYDGNGDGESSSIDEVRSRMKRSWMPFGHGSKSCIGQALAMMAVESAISSFIKKFTLRRSHADSLKFTQTPTMRLKDMYVDIEERQDNGSVGRRGNVGADVIISSMEVEELVIDVP